MKEKSAHKRVYQFDTKEKKKDLKWPIWHILDNDSNLLRPVGEKRYRVHTVVCTAHYHVHFNRSVVCCGMPIKSKYIAILMFNC